jgi:sugar lactone lactonase YvrE
MTVTVFGEHQCLLGEGPVWDSNNATLLWIDIMKGEILEWAPGMPHVKIMETGSPVGSFALTRRGKIIAALQEGIVLFNRTTGEKQVLHQPETHLPENRFNDGKCDPAGRFWAGTMKMNEIEATGSVYSTDGVNIIKRMEEVTVSNGLAWSLDRRYFYFIDSPTLEIVRYDYDVSTGTIHNKTLVVKMDIKEGYPDGMTIDAEGMLWVAHWDGWQVARWNPDTGEKICSIAMPVAKPTSVCFGGNKMDELYVTSDSRGLSKEDWLQQPLAGRCFIIKNLGVKGFELEKFNDD